MTKICVLLPLLLLLSLTQAQMLGSTSSLSDGLLLSVGEATPNSVVVLYEFVPGAEMESGGGDSLDLTATVTLIHSSSPSSNDNVDDEVKETHIVVAKRFPQSYIFRNLKEGREYSIKFEGNAISPSQHWEVRFRTVDRSSSKKSKPFSALVLSCNRVVEDGDTLFLEELAKVDLVSYDAILHIGDQVYADRLGLTLKAERERTKKEIVKMDDVIEWFRQVYRDSWAIPVMQSILRRGTHYMIPDDHEVVNNADPRLFTTNKAVIPLLLAGRQAFYEYQMQLRQPLHPALLGGKSWWDDFGQPRSREIAQAIAALPPVHYFLEFNKVGIVLLDTRFDRVYGEENRNKTVLMGQKQEKDVLRQLQQWNKNKNIDQIVVISSIPLLFQAPAFAWIAEFVEHELYPSHELMSNSTLRLMDILRDYGRPKLNALVGGDVHHAAHLRACYDSSRRTLPRVHLEAEDEDDEDEDDEKKQLPEDTNWCVDEYFSSGLTWRSTVGHEWKLFFFDWASAFLTSMSLGPWYMPYKSGYFGRNFMRLSYSQGGQLLIERITASEEATRVHIANFIFHITPLIPRIVFSVLVMIACVWQIKRSILRITNRNNEPAANKND